MDILIPEDLSLGQQHCEILAVSLYQNSTDLLPARGQNLVALFWTAADVHSIYIMDEVFQNASQAHAVFLPHRTMHNTLECKEVLRLIASGYWIITLCFWEPEHKP